MKRVGVVIAIALLAACGDNDDSCASWKQWGNSASHDGASCVIGQTLELEFQQTGQRRRRKLHRMSASERRGRAILSLSVEMPKA